MMITLSPERNGRLRSEAMEVLGYGVAIHSEWAGAWTD